MKVGLLNLSQEERVANVSQFFNASNLMFAFESPGYVKFFFFFQMVLEVWPKGGGERGLERGGWDRG